MSLSAEEKFNKLAEENPTIPIFELEGARFLSGLKGLSGLTMPGNLDCFLVACFNDKFFRFGDLFKNGSERIFVGMVVPIAPMSLLSESIVLFTSPSLEAVEEMSFAEANGIDWIQLESSW